MAPNELKMVPNVVLAILIVGYLSHFHKSSPILLSER